LNRKLLILDVVLVAVLAYAGFQFRDLFRTSKTHETQGLHHPVPAAPVPQFPPTPAPSAVMATSYIEIPHKFLLDPSRNSEVAPDPPPAPPPPKPMPPLPLYHGQMNLGDGLFAILSASKTGPHEAIHKGESIGEFKLLSVNKEGIDLEWDGKLVHKTLDELTDRSAAPLQAEANPQRAVAAAPPPPVAQPERPLGPSESLGADGARGCQANDSNPAGAVVDGYKKVLRQSPFGAICSWMPLSGTGRN
jgi:hypothetical protein